MDSPTVMASGEQCDAGAGLPHKTRRESLEIVRGKNSGHVGGFAGPLAKAGSGAGQPGREGKKLTAAAPAAADGESSPRLLRVWRVVFVKTG